MKKTMWIVFFFASFFIFSTVVTAEEASKEIMNELEKEFNSFRETHSEELVANTEKAMAPHSSILAWKIPWTEELGALQCIGSLRVGHD